MLALLEKNAKVAFISSVDEVDELLSGVARKDTLSGMRATQAELMVRVKSFSSVQCLSDDDGASYIAVFYHENEVPSERPREMNGYRVEYYSVYPAE